MKRKLYAIPKVSEEGEDVTVGAKAFDRMLGRMLVSPPLKREDIRPKRKGVQQRDNP